MNFTPIRISTIIPNKDLSFELYIYFKNHYIKYKESGEAISDGLIQKLKLQNLARFFILDTDEERYQKFLDEILLNTLDNPDSNIEEKTTIVEGAASSAIDQMQNNPGSKSSYEMTKKAASSLQKLILGNPEALKTFYGQSSGEQEVLIKHGLNVSALSVSLGSSCGLNEDNILNLSVAGLLHDIGISRLSGPDQELFFKPHAEMSGVEKGRYEQHPLMGVNILKQNPFVNPQILDLILHHEEKHNGNGYPDKLLKIELNQEVLNICCCYDQKVTAFKMSPKQAIKSLQIDEVGNFTLELINYLKDHLKKEGII